MTVIVFVICAANYKDTDIYMWLLLLENIRWNYFISHESTHVHKELHYVSLIILSLDYIRH